MIVKKFYGRTVEETISKVKEDLGEDATLLLVQKVKKKGLRGMFGLTEVEITAAKEINFELHEKVSSTPYKDEIISDFPALYELKDILKKEEVDNDIINNIISNYIEATGGNKIKLKTLDTNIVETLLNNLIKVEKLSLDKAKLLSIFIGPPGVGKTTTLLKLASYYALEKNRDTAIITTDIYRTGAVEQLKMYGKILDIPIEVAFNVREFERALRRFDSKDVVLIDSAGRNRKDGEYIERLRKFIYTIPLQGLRIYLVMSIIDNFRYLKEIFATYKQLHPTSVVMTKLDEAVSLGNVINIPTYTDLPIAYITNGQNIPGDIEPGESKKLANLILKRNVRIDE